MLPSLPPLSVSVHTRVLSARVLGSAKAVGGALWPYHVIRARFVRDEEHSFFFNILGGREVGTVLDCEDTYDSNSSRSNNYYLYFVT